MNFSFSKLVKAASINAAFLFCFSAAALPNSFDNVRNKASELLAQKKKDQALRLIISYSRTERSRPYKKEAGELLFLAAQTFLTKEAQEEYEVSLNATLDNDKIALKAADRCLAIEPQNLDCLIQRARCDYRLKNEKSFGGDIAKIREILSNTQYDALFALLLEKNEEDFKNKQVGLVLNDKMPEIMFIFTLMELDRSFLAKNYSLAKDIVIQLEKNNPDWPDLIFYKNKLNLESEEEQAKSSPELLAAYSSKCKSISKSAARKFRYDFELCMRGAKQ